MTTGTAPIRVVVADDHAIVREGIRRVLEGADLLVVGEAGTGTDAVAVCEAQRPDVAVLDVNMPGETGLAAAARLRIRCPAVRVLILSMHDNPEYLLEAMRVGAAGYLLKDSAGTELREAVHVVHGGRSYLSPEVAGKLSAALRQEVDRTQRGARLGLLSPREREVLAGIARGQTNKEIAGDLGISHRTVETHRENLMQKLELRTVAELTRFALEQGLLRADGPPPP